MAKKEKTIFIWDAIQEMRKLTARRIPFSFAHFTFDSTTGRSRGERYVSRAMLRPASADDDIRHSSFKLFYDDLSQSTKIPRNCWQPLISRFNDVQVTFKLDQK